MKLQFLLTSVIGAGLFLLASEAVAQQGRSGVGAVHGGGSRAGHGSGAVGGHHGGGSWASHGGGTWGGHRGSSWAGHRGGAAGNHAGGSWAGRAGGAWAGHSRFAWGGHSHGFHHGRRFFSPGFAFYGFGYPWWWDWYYPGYSYYPYPYSYDSDPYYDSVEYSGTYYRDQYDENRDATKAIQAALARRGYYRGPIDGELGPQTRSAIQSFQAHQGLPITGQVDGRLIRALQS